MNKRIASLTACCLSLWAGSAGMSLLLCRFLGIPLTPDTGNRYTDESVAHYLLSIGGALRLQMHTTVLYVGVFAALGLAGLMWVYAEKWQNESEWSRQDVIWMISFGALLACSAILYRVGANSVLTRKFAVAGTMADVFGVGVALSVPVILWFRWHKPNQPRSHRSEDESLSSFQYSRTILGLQDYSPPPAPQLASARQPLAEPVIIPPVAAVTQPPPTQPAEWLERTFHQQSEPAKEQTRNEVTVMENMNILSINPQSMPATSQPTSSQPETTSQPFAAHQAPPEPGMAQSLPPQPMAAPQPTPAQPVAYQPATGQPPAQERSNAPSATFRDQLFALNNSWQRIESTGKEVEDWFQRQQKLVMAHMERPVVKSHDSHMDLSRDFLEQRMDRVDAEWATIHQTVRELYRWLENGRVENGSSEREAPQETKVW